jgi:peptidoglycan/LPS O-acetylase OafA/YrhL
MGCFRFLLAASVVLSHFAFYPGAFPHPLLGDVAVEAFYIISGFLITLVLHQKYRGSRFTFYTNRALRIYPIYWVSLLLYFVADWLLTMGYFPPAPAWGAPYYQGTSAMWWWGQSGAKIEFVGMLGVSVANLMILGQDILTFLNADGMFHATGLDLFYQKFFIVRVAWSVAIELMFYAVAPFIVTRLWLVCTVLGLSLSAQLLTHLYLPLSPDWFSRIFPFALTYFMAGSLAYRGYVWLAAHADDASKSRVIANYATLSCLTLVLLTLLFDRLPLGRIIYLTATTICLPGIVAAGRRIPFDGFLGDLSYPIYLIHPLFMIVVIESSKVPSISAEGIAIAGTLLISVALVYLIERPVDRFRQSRVLRGTGTVTATTLGRRLSTEPS